MRKLIHLLKLGWTYKVTHSTKLAYPPYQYTIEPTNQCNLKCNFCPQSDPAHHQLRPIGKLSEENCGLFLTKIKEVGSGNGNINFTLDGEPFINKSFVSFIRLAAEHGFFSIFASNGIFINQKISDELDQAGPFCASIDFASNKEIFETIRGQEGHFDLVLSNLKYLMKLAINNRNIHLDVHDITSFAGSDAEESLAKMRALFPSSLPGRIRFDSRQFHNFCGHLDARKKSDNYRLCPYPWTQMAVTYNGDCVPCCRDTVGRSVLGNVFESSIMDVWNDEPYRTFRNNLLNRRPDLNAACKDCDLPYSGGQPRWKLKYILRSLLGR
jgi:radical SAM protein with 4Fe4S-binding SPASM domain